MSDRVTSLALIDTLNLPMQALASHNSFQHIYKFIKSYQPFLSQRFCFVDRLIKLPWKTMRDRKGASILPWLSQIADEALAPSLLFM